MWRLPALAALLVVSGCKDLMPSYMGGDVGAASLHGSACGTGGHAQGRCASAPDRFFADSAAGRPGVSSTHAIVAANVPKQGAQSHS